MRVRRYVVNNMSEAMVQIRAELGKEAVILSQRKIKQKGVFGFMKPKQLEVTAAIENSKSKNVSWSNQFSQSSNRANMDQTSSENNFNDSIMAMTQALKQHSKTSEEEKNITEEKIITEDKKTNDITELYRNKVKTQLKQDGEKKAENNEILNEIGQLKNILAGMKNGTADDKRHDVIEILEDLDIDKEYFDEFISIIPNEMTEKEAIKKEIKGKVLKDIEYLEFPKGAKIVLAGPTGVGKTTTIAKLAGKFALHGNKKVGLITIDTYRIGAVEQLKTYAEIMNVPIKVVFTTMEMEQALQELSYCDVILVDTTGRSSKNNMQVSELRSYIDKVATENIFLVVSATTKNKDLKTIIEGFKSLNYTGLILTKLDETSTYGMSYNAFRKAEKPISLVTVGQNVPDDIKDAHPEYISRLIVGEETL